MPFAAGLCGNALRLGGGLRAWRIPLLADKRFELYPIPGLYIASLREIAGLSAKDAGGRDVSADSTARRRDAAELAHDFDTDPTGAPAFALHRVKLTNWVLE